MLDTRLTKVIDKLISPNQLTFFKEGLLVDGVIVVNELVDLTKKIKNDYLILTVDFEKVYEFL